MASSRDRLMSDCAWRVHPAIRCFSWGFHAKSWVEERMSAMCMSGFVLVNTNTSFYSTFGIIMLNQNFILVAGIKKPDFCSCNSHGNIRICVNTLQTHSSVEQYMFHHGSFITYLQEDTYLPPPLFSLIMLSIIIWPSLLHSFFSSMSAVPFFTLQPELLIPVMNALLSADIVL